MTKRVDLAMAEKYLSIYVHFAETIQIKVVKFLISSKHGIVIKRVQFKKGYGLFDLNNKEQ